MPTLTTLSFEQADVMTHSTLSSHISTFMGVLVYIFSVIAVWTLATFLMEIRENATMQPINQPSGLTIDLIDALLCRKAKLDHDKAFALRNVLQQLSKAKIPQPDCDQPLDKTFADLNCNLSQAIGCSRLLTVASIIPLSGHPTWMVNWSTKPDAFWTSNTRHGFEKVGAISALQEWPVKYEHSKNTVTANRELECNIMGLCRVEHCFEFEPTHNFDDDLGHKYNLETGMRLAKHSEAMLGIMHNCKSKLIALLRLTAPDVGRADLTKWVNFLYDKSHNPESAFFLLLRDPRLLQTQMLICNQLSTNGRKLFLYKSEKLEETTVGRKNTRSFFCYVFGICSTAVQEVDFLIEVPGASTPLIVRLIEGKAHLVSPAILREERMVFGGREKVVFA